MWPDLADGEQLYIRTSILLIALSSSPKFWQTTSKKVVQ
jgi:hypothetical protein